MKLMKRGTAILLGIALTLSLITGTYMVIAASKNWDGAQLGDLSQYYETGNSADPGYISTVKGDSGGTSYGIYMFASNANTPYRFATWLYNHAEDSLYHAIGSRLLDAYNYNSSGAYSPGYGSNFNANWQSIAITYPNEFMQSQKDYWEDAYYTTLLSNIKNAFPAFDINDYSIALRNVFWSRSVQHGTDGATSVITKAFNSLGGFKHQSEAELIEAIYAECSKLDTSSASRVMSGDTAAKYGVSGRSMAYYSANSGAVQMSVYRRLHVNEPADALVMLYANRSAELPDGVYRLLDHTNQSRALSVDGSLTGLDTTSASQQVLVTYFSSGYYTLSINGKRLTDNGSSVSFSNPTAKNDQLWKLVSSDMGYLLKNRSTEHYLSINNGTVTSTNSADNAAVWQCKPDGSQWQTAGLFYPGCEKNLTHKLVAGSSSFPIRGVITSPLPITSVSIQITQTSSGGGSGKTSTSKTVTPSGTAYYYDLWLLDDYITVSALQAGTYKCTITASNSEGTTTLAESTFTVSPNSGSTRDDETYLVTFDPNGGICSVKTATYKLGQVYGELPVATKDGYEFMGWFMADGTEVTPTSTVAAENHTLTAKYGDLYTVTFLNANGSALKTLKLATGERITAPSNPVKASDGNYTYSFSHWVDENGQKFVGGMTYMGTSSITYTPVFTSTEVTPEPGPDTTSDGYLTGIAPGTSVASLNAGGYEVYSGTSKVTSGSVATGMVAKSGKNYVTVVVTGDTNGDGKISITDVVKLQSHVVGKSSLSGAYSKAGDINGDGKITITDVVQAAQVTVGKRAIG